METRPKIKIELSQGDRALEYLGFIILLLMWGLTLYIFLKSPAIIPIHFNASGQADNYGSKTTLLLLPIFATIIYLGLSQLNKYPHIFNYITKITIDNAKQQYIIATRMLRFLKLSVLIVFILIILFTYFTTMGVTNGLGSWFVPLIFGLFLVPVIISIVKSLRAK